MLTKDNLDLDDPRVARYLQRKLRVYQFKVKVLKDIVKQETKIRERLTTILTKTATALKGHAPDDVAHDWSDLPRVAKYLREDLARLQPNGPEARMVTEKRIDELRLEMRESAARFVVRYAAEHAPHVAAAKVHNVAGAIGDISVEDAVKAIEKLEKEATA